MSRATGYAALAVMPAMALIVSADTIVYDNTIARSFSGVNPNNGEVGDGATLAGTERLVTKLSLMMMIISGAEPQNAEVNVLSQRPPEEKDQFLPSVTVDDQGRIHVIFYDDRNYEQTHDPPTLQPKFDVYYAVSTNQGATFTNFELYAVPAAPALEFSLTRSFPGPASTSGVTNFGGRRATASRPPIRWSLRAR